MVYNETPIKKPSPDERTALRLMILVGLLAMGFFLFTFLQKENIGYWPLYVMLMITMVYYCLKFLHEWYHYFSIDSPEVKSTSKVYSVDILTTYCKGEPFDMLSATLQAIQAITYPHTSWCCDEADDPDVKALCEKLGVNHVTRIEKKDAKAGNINNALQFATGELCVVLDPDHVPCPAFLNDLVAYFDNPKVGFVQVVQAYYNKKESMVAKGAAQQTFQFYGPMMMCMHSYGTVQAIGANCTFRRSALDSIGGHASGLSEDMHTAMKLHAGGWTSVYHPAILTRGLVPATLSSYYKQQLKWSRGTFELLVTAYPKLFRNFTWRQKIHYFTLPFHYLCGFIFLVNFLIPIIALFTGFIPLKMDIISFMLASVPLFAMAVLIRHYVQQWVAEEIERGFHIVGGLLQIGTWWIHLVGFVYTVLRKKVPYLPTPKNDNDSLPIQLILPNIGIAVITVAAIIYGIVNHYNPYTFFMLVFAGMQLVFMLFMVLISRPYTPDKPFNKFIKELRNKTWLIIQMHGFLRRYAVILAFLVVTTFIFAYQKSKELPQFSPYSLSGQEIFYPGIFQPAADNGITTVSTVFNATDKNLPQVAIASFYLPWGTSPATKLPIDSLTIVYQNNAIPLITWEPWQNEMMGDSSKDEFVFLNILSGKYDGFIKDFAQSMAALDKPIFLRFAHEPENTRYPWSPGGKNKPADFIKAWQYVHSIFEQEGASQVIWVYNPWKAANAQLYFPGNNYVDWLGVNILDYNPGNNPASSLSFKSLYEPFHRLRMVQEGLPVMITETGTLSTDKKGWIDSAFYYINSEFKEIKSVILFNNQYDHYNEDGYTQQPLAWGMDLGKVPINTIGFDTVLQAAPIDITIPGKPAFGKQLPGNIRGTVYNKGYQWFRNRHTLTQKELEKDILEIKNLGINTIIRTMPGFYDPAIGRQLTKNNIRMIASWWPFNETAQLKDDSKMEKEKKAILSFVKSNLDDKNILAWNIAGDVLYRLDIEYNKPDYLFFRNRYIKWLSEVCTAIKKIDTTRALTLNVHWDELGESRAGFYKKYISQVDNYMAYADSTNSRALSGPLPEGVRWGIIPAELWNLLPKQQQQNVFIPEWQDTETVDHVNLNGLFDFEGRKKDNYYIVANSWGKQPVAMPELPGIRILRPANVTVEGDALRYHALLKAKDGSWQFINGSHKEFRFEWYLARTNNFGDPLFIKKIGEENSVTVTIPRDPQFYKLYLKRITEKGVTISSSVLNLPFY